MAQKQANASRCEKEKEDKKERERKPPKEPNPEAARTVEIMFQAWGLVFIGYFIIMLFFRIADILE